MEVKAVIFDLDNTLFDCMPSEIAAFGDAKKVMLELGLDPKLVPKIDSLYKTTPFLGIVNEMKDAVPENILDAGYKTYSSAGVGDDIKPFPDVVETLKGLKVIKILVTYGDEKIQWEKINKLGLAGFFDEIYVFNSLESGKTKKDVFAHMLEKLKLEPEEVVVVGDQLFSEIRHGNDLGMHTVQMLHGRHSKSKPSDNLEIPEHKIKKISDLLRILDLDENKTIKIVSIGGGTGQPALLRGLKKYTENITAIVCVTDTGRNSGMLRKELSILPPGDIRNCLIALSNSEDLLKSLFSYRFENGSLEGNSVGNIFLAALTKITGSFESAIKEMSRILKLNGKVLPATLDDVHICAELQDGSVIEGEVNILNRDIAANKNLKRVFLKPGAKALEECTKEIMDADLIIIGPGALYTSVITNLLVAGMPEAINSSRAKKVFVCNITEMPNQTRGFSASGHVKEIIKYLSGKLDFVVINTGIPEKDIVSVYEKQGSPLVRNDVVEIEKLGARVVESDVLTKDIRKDVWNRLDYLRHDPDELAECIIGIAQKKR